MNDKKLLLGVAIGIGGLLVLEAIILLFVTLFKPKAPVPSPVTGTPTITVSPVITTVAPTVTVSTTVTPTISTSVTPSVTVTGTVNPTATVAKYKYSIPVEAVTYEPNSTIYTGFRTCDIQNSTCTVYGIKSALLAKAVLGGSYMLSFNATNGCNAAAGTSYCEVQGDFLLK